MITVSAVAKFNPNPPALVDKRKIKSNVGTDPLQSD
jgi:hypothetical protein